MFKNFMKDALEEAKVAFSENEVPIGAVLVQNGEIIAKGHNLCESRKNPTMHAEMVVLNKGFEVLNTKCLNDCDLYVTVEPCCMCAYAISMARIRRLYFGCSDKKNGCVVTKIKIYQNTLELHKPEIYCGILENECRGLVSDFFEKIRSS
jgi:tRNA(adenine34) deaminase